MNATIIDRGRGPEIAGTRITVYDIMDYYTHGRHENVIAAILRLSTEQVRVAIRYIEEHREEVEANYQRILDRIAQPYTPEVQAKVDESHRRFEQRLRELGIKRPEGANGAERSDCR